MNQYLGLGRLQRDALDRHLATGTQPNKMGFMLDAVSNGLAANFQGNALFDLTAINAQGVVALTGPHYVWGAPQLMALRASADVPSAGFPVASGVARLTNADVDANAACALTQENALWIPQSESFSFAFDVIARNIDNDETVSFAEVGVCSTIAVITDIVDDTKEPATLNAFAAVKIVGNMMYLRIRHTASGAITSSGAIAVPGTAFSVKVDYQYANGAGHTSIYVNGNIAASIPGVINSSLQVFARACHGANYVALTHTPAILDLDSVIVSVPRG